MKKVLTGNIVEIVKEMQGGDLEHLAQFIDMTHDFLYRQTRKYCDIEDEREQAVQQTYHIVIRKIGTLKEPENILAWMSVIAAHESAAIMRERKDSSIVSYDSIGSDANEEDPERWQNKVLEDTSNNIDDYIEKTSMASAMNEIMGMLPDYQRLPLWMYYGQGIPITEIADNMGVSENTIKSRLKQGRDKLYKMKGEFLKRGIEVAGVSIVVLIKTAWDTDLKAEAAELGITALSGITGGAAAAASGKGKAAAKTAGKHGKKFISSVRHRILMKSTMVGTAAAVTGGSIIGFSRYQDDLKLKKVIAEGSRHLLIHNSFTTTPKDIKILDKTVKADFEFGHAIWYDVSYHAAKNLISYDVHASVMYDKNKKEYTWDGIFDYNLHSFDITGKWEGDVYTYHDLNTPVGHMTMTIDDFTWDPSSDIGTIQGSYECDIYHVSDITMIGGPVYQNELYRFTDSPVDSAGNILSHRFYYDPDKNILTTGPNIVRIDLKKISN